MVRSSRFIGNWKDHANNVDEEYVNNVKVGSWSTGAPNLTITSGLTVSAGSLTPPNVANLNTAPGIPVIYRIDVTAVGASEVAENFDITVADKIRVIDVMAIKTAGTTGGGAENISVLSTGAAITDVMSWTGADKLVVRPITIDDAQSTISAGGILRVTVDTSITDETGDTGLVVITALKTA